MDNNSAFNKRRRVEDSIGNSRAAALETELLRLRAENARLLQERQNQHQHQQQHQHQHQQQTLPSLTSTSAASALDRLAVLRSLASPSLSSNFSALTQQQQQRLPSIPNASRLTGLSTDQLLSLAGSSAAGLRSLPGLASTANTTVNSGNTPSFLGQAFQQRLQHVQQQQQQQQQQRQQQLQASSTSSLGGLSEEMRQRLNRLQQLSDLQNQTAATASNTTGPRPTFRASALPTPRNNNNLSVLDEIVQSHFPSQEEDKKRKLETILSTTATTTTTPKKMTNPNTEETSKSGRKRKPQLLYMSCDDQDLSQYQTHVRKQIEVFEADCEDTATSARGRNRPIVAGQVGIRCKHCKVVPPQHRQRAAIYYPSKLDRLYQMSQTIASVHLADYCQHIPATVRAELARLRETKSAALGGKKYWADAGRAMGLVQVDKRLFFADSEEAKQAQTLAESKPEEKESASALVVDQAIQ